MYSTSVIQYEGNTTNNKQNIVEVKTVLQKLIYMAVYMAVRITELSYYPAHHNSS
jgi:hypothetical protein